MVQITEAEHEKNMAQVESLGRMLARTDIGPVTRTVCANSHAHYTQLVDQYRKQKPPTCHCGSCE